MNLKITYEVLKEINSGNKNFSHEDLGITKDELGDILEELLNEGYVKNIRVMRGGWGNPVIGIILENAKVTFKGATFLETKTF